MSKIDRNTVAALALGAAMGVLAVLPAAAQGTPAQRMACTGDAMSLCSADVPDVGRITACLRRERAHVSAACQQAMGLGPATTSVASASARVTP